MKNDTLPPLPEPEVYAIGDYYHEYVKWSKAFTPSQMHAYARAALAAHTPPTSPCHCCDRPDPSRPGRGCGPL